MNVLVGTSLVAAFVAGVAALFAPCCITVLLPSYLGSIFRERKQVFLMTFIFFLGVLLVFLPLGFGSAAFGQFLSRYHSIIFALGGLMLLALGVTLLLGIRWSLPLHVNPTLKSHHPFSVFTLGIFSGIATTCCAPVLAGVLALSALPGSVFLGVMYTVAYVLGMVTPLFVLATLMDRTKATQRLMKLRKPFSYRVFSRTIHITLTDLVAGVIFFGIGILTLSLAVSNRLQMQSAYQTSINAAITKFLQGIQGVVDLLPQSGWAAVFALFFVAILIRVIFLFRKEQHHES